MPLELRIRNRQVRARRPSKMATLRLSMVKAAAGIWGGEWERAGLGREWDPFTPHLLRLDFPRP